MREKFGLEYVTRDGCQVGAKDEHGKLLKHEWTIMTNSWHIRRLLHRRCPGGHEHGRAAEGERLRPGAYSSRMADLLVKALLKEQRGGFMEIWANDHDANPTATNGDEDDTTVRQALTNEEFSKWKELPDQERARLLREAHKLHIHCGHRPAEVLTKALR